MFENFLYNLWIFNARDELHLAPTPVTLLYFYRKDPLQSLRPEKNSASSSMPCWQIVNSLAIRSLTFSVQHALAICSAGRKPRETA